MLESRAKKVLRSCKRAVWHLLATDFANIEIFLKTNKFFDAYFWGLLRSKEVEVIKKLSS